MANKLLLGLINRVRTLGSEELQSVIRQNIEILTNPDVLSDYTLQFFGPEGPYPVYESEQQLETTGYPTAPTSLGGAAMPAPPAQSSPCLLYTSPSPRDRQKSRMPSSA